MKGAPLTVPEARAILVADEALDYSYEHRLSTGQILGAAEGDAWRKLVESATNRIAAWEGTKTVPSGEIA